MNTFFKKQKLQLAIALTSLEIIENCEKAIAESINVEYHKELKAAQEAKYAGVLADLFKETTQTINLDITELHYHED